MIRVLGLDPGLAHTGYGIIDAGSGRFRHITHGVISTPPDMEIGDRLNTIYERLGELVREFRPREAGVENLYFARNITSALPVAQARGVALLVFAREEVFCQGYPPQAIKQALVGNGRADKKQVAELVRLLLGLPELPRPDHAADALAAAICHANTREGTPNV